MRWDRLWAVIYQFRFWVNYRKSLEVEVWPAGHGSGGGLPAVENINADWVNKTAIGISQGPISPVNHRNKLQPE
jgi:hypothetical protein